MQSLSPVLRGVTRSPWLMSSNSLSFLLTSITKRLFLVWKDAEERKLQLAFEYTKVEGEKAELIAMRRPYDEDWAQAKQKIRQRIGKPQGGKNRKKGKNAGAPEAEPSTRIEIKHSLDGASDHEVTNWQLFYEKCIERLHIGAVEYNIVRDAPLLEEFSIQLRPLVGCPLMVRSKWKMAPQSLGQPPRLHWFATNDVRQHSPASAKELFEKWTHLHTGDVLLLTEEHKGHRVAVALEIEVGGEQVFSLPFVCKQKVHEVGEEFIFEERQRLYCSQKLEGSLYRLASYNILADLYLKSSLKKGVQAEFYFPFCPREYQAAEYRYPIVLRELAGYNVDLMFLQEVDKRMEVHYLSRFLPTLHLSYAYQCKSDGLNEGLAVVFNPERFRLVEDRSVYVRDLLCAVKHPENKDVEDWLMAMDPKHYRYFASRQTLLQVVHLKCIGNDEKEIIAANIHLPSYSVDTEDVRIAMLLICLRHLIVERQQLATNEGREPPLIIFGGDFNCEPTDKITRLLQDGQLPKEADNGSWKIAADDENLSFQSLTGFPDYTNFTHMEGMQGFVGCLDYIWALPQLNVRSVTPAPRHELVTSHGALPSEIAPSDHLPIICEVQI